MTMSKRVSFSVIIPTKNRSLILSETLALLQASIKGFNVQVVIINDGDALPYALPFPECQLFKNHHAGVASARNLGISKATAEWLIFMDDDMWLQPDTFDRLAKLELRPDYVYNLNWIYPPQVMDNLFRLPFLRYLNRYGFNSLKGWSSDVAWKNEGLFQVNGVTSQFLLMHRSTYNLVGGYDTSFPFAGFEDYDLSVRLRGLGIPILVDPNNIIYHNEADRLELKNWLDRKWRGAVTRRVAVALGHHELALKYSILKYGFYRMVYAFRKPILSLLAKWPASTVGDLLFFWIINCLLGSYSCMGYTSKQAADFASEPARVTNA